ncbi:nuclear transport factor 2 family protein [Algibacter sp. 2305UL17-15]|uniref:nuclear transport factor 2 family protein n=1 Tax=Algibacter sp. 2305UL17-15 TaxID=3231268 RepID=UPI003457FBB8
MTTKDVADKLVNYCRQGQFEEAVKALYAQNIVSIEPEGAPVKVSEGLEAVIAKGQQFQEMTEEVHGMEVSDPVVADKFFACTMKMDITFKGAPRTSMEEVCLYKVENGKIVREEFFFTPMQQA